MFSICLRELDKNLRALDLHEHYSKFGNVVYISIDHDEDRQISTRTARVIFSDGISMPTPVDFGCRQQLDERTFAIPTVEASHDLEMGSNCMEMGHIINDAFVPISKLTGGFIVKIQPHKHICHWRFANDLYSFECSFNDLDQKFVQVDMDNPAMTHFLTLKLRRPPRIFSGREEMLEELGMWDFKVLIFALPQLILVDCESHRLDPGDGNC